MTDKVITILRTLEWLSGDLLWILVVFAQPFWVSYLLLRLLAVD